MARHLSTRPAHDLAAYAGEYEHPAYGVMSIKKDGEALDWSWRGMAVARVREANRPETGFGRDNVAPREYEADWAA
jgi:hypothetical protein